MLQNQKIMKDLYQIQDLKRKIKENNPSNNYQNKFTRDIKCKR